MKAGLAIVDGERDDFAFRSSNVFRGIEYVISATTTNNGRTLVVEVEDKLTADQWRGKFDAAYVEDLTRKTGNFKQFPVFVSMLQSALEKNSDSVALDLLTYSDLELLRNRKVGTTAKPIVNSQALVQQNKRYLILIYSVEFDRIHYPLPLPYQGKPDPVHLQNLVRQLTDEIRKLKTAQIGLQDEDYEQLKEDYEVLLQEKHRLQMDLENLKCQVKDSTGMAVSKEVRVLKKVVQNLEMEMVKEKNRYQRQMAKKTAEVKRLALELQEVQAKERTLQIRVKSLTNELAMYKRRRTPIPSARPSTANGVGRSSRGVARLTDSAASFNRSGSRARSYSRSQSRDRPQNRSVVRERSVSKERRPLSALRSNSRGRTPTPRFDPTSYIEERKRKQRESQERRKRKVMSDFTPESGESYRGRTRARVNLANRRSSSRERYRGSILRDRSSSADSRRSSNGSVSRTRHRPTVAWEYTPERDTGPSHRKRSSTPDPDRYRGTRGKRVSQDEQEYSDNMAEIDARLTALQQYMQELGAGN